jgi:hypothetical protein
MRFRLCRQLYPILPLLAWCACATPDDGFTIRFRSEAPNRSSFQERIFAVRADGSSAQQFLARRRAALGLEPVLPGSQWRQVLDRERGVQVSVHPHNQTKITVPLRERDQPAGPGCADSEGLLSLPGEQADAILGYDVIHLSGRRELPDGSSMALEEWRAPALGCAALRIVTSLRRADGSELGGAAEEAVSVSLGPPDPGLFAIPRSFLEQGSLLEQARGGATQDR